MTVQIINPQASYCVRCLEKEEPVLGRLIGPEEDLCSVCECYAKYGHDRLSGTVLLNIQKIRAVPPEIAKAAEKFAEILADASDEDWENATKLVLLNKIFPSSSAKSSLTYENVDTWTLSQIIQQYCYLRQSDEINPGQCLVGDWLVTVLEKYLEKVKVQFTPNNDTSKRLVAELFFYEHHFTTMKVLADAICSCYDPKQEYVSLVEE